MYSIGIDIGGTSAKTGLVLGNKVIREERIPTGADLDYEQFLGQAGSVISNLCREYPVAKAGISSCGLIDSRSGRILYSNNIRWENKPITEDMEKRTGISVRIANDAKCAALAEAVLGAGKGYERVCMITLGTGVGGGFIRGGRLEEGASSGNSGGTASTDGSPGSGGTVSEFAGGAPDSGSVSRAPVSGSVSRMRSSVYADGDSILGHITVEHKGRRCTCGRRGCLEAYASAGALVRTYQEKTGSGISAREVFERARAGEKEAKETVALFTHYLGEGLVSLVNVLRPEIIVLGGGISESADLFLEELKRTVNRDTYGGRFLPVEIAGAQLGNQAGMIGAALL